MNKKRVLEQLSPNWTIRIDDSEVIEIDVSTVEDRKKLEHDLVHKCNNVAARIELGK